MKKFAAGVFVLFVMMGILRAQTRVDVVRVGEVDISMPVPEQFVRLDGVDADYDKMRNTLLMKNNRVLALYGGEEILADIMAQRTPPNHREFYAQTLRDGESENMTAADFAEFKDAAKPKLGNAKSLEEGMAELNDVLRAANVSAPVPLGVFDETPASISFATLMKVGTNPSRPTVIIIAASVCLVRGKMVMLYASAPYDTKADIEWAKAAVKRWRDSVINSNN